MTESELLFLVYGIVIGLELMTVMNTFWARRDARRARAESAAALHRAAGDLFFSTFRVYRLQQRTGVRR